MSATFPKGFLAKSTCTSCFKAFDFQIEQAGQTALCPFCGNQTVLEINQYVEMTQNFNSKTRHQARPEAKLDLIGNGCFWLSVLAAIVGGIIAIGKISSLDYISAIIWFGAGIGCLAWGFILKYCFHGLAEIIRLLRKQAV